MAIADKPKLLPKALAFDVFGTVVDWRTSITRESAGYLSRIGRDDIDAASFADAWRNRYIGSMKAFKDSARAYVTLDVLHREMLDATLQALGIDPATIDEALLNEWNEAWHRLDPWPDTVLGLSRLKVRFPIVTLSNGHISMMLAMARRGGLPWDAILGAEVSRAYKPDPRAYLGTAEVMSLKPSELCLAAAHHSDLAAARNCGLMTAFIHRPREYGGASAPDANLALAWDWSASSILDLAAQLGC